MLEIANGIKLELIKINSFIPPRTLQEVQGRGLKGYSRYSYNLQSNTNFFKDLGVTQPRNPDIFSFLKGDECEDVLALYLQKEKGYYFIPSTCKSSTQHYEFELINPNTGQSAVTQVKNGYDDLNTKDFSQIEGEVFLFTTKGKYHGQSYDHIHCINPSNMKDFATNNRNLMPAKIRYWMDVLDRI